MSLLELIVAAALLSLTIPLLLNLLPQGLRLLQQSGRLQQANLLAVYRMDQTRLAGPREIHEDTETVHVDGLDYKLVRRITYATDDGLSVDVRVTCTVDQAPPVQLYTRLLRNSL